MHEVISKLERLEPWDSLNKLKFGILMIGKHLTADQENVRGIPIVTSYKYLGVDLVVETKMTITKAKQRMLSLVARLLPSVKRLQFEAKHLIATSLIKATTLYQMLPFCNSQGKYSEVDANLYDRVAKATLGIRSCIDLSQIREALRLSSIKEVIERILG